MTSHGSILVTGFAPFAGDAVNPSQQVVQALDGQTIDGHTVVGAVLPVAFAQTPALLDTLLVRHRPRLVLALGLACGRAELSFERVAINLIDARIADNDGDQPIDQAVTDDAPAAYFATLPLKAIVAQLHEAGIPAALSLSAGSFVCNQVFYLLAHRLASRSPLTRSGFVHLPLVPEQVAAHPGQPSMTLAMMIEGIRIAIECALVVRSDLRVHGGSIA